MTTNGGYECLRVQIARGVAWVTIDHPPINLFDVPLFLELDRVVTELAADDQVRVIGFQSADPDFFIAHADVNWILTLPAEKPPVANEPNPFVQLTERIRRIPKLTIGAIAGIARGGGSEFLLALDVRFAARTKTRLSQPEVALGIIPGGGGTQRLARLIGRARALEIVLGCEDIDADTAASIGYVNRVFADDDLLAHAQAFAERVAAMPPHAVRMAKEAIDGAVPSWDAGLVAETNLFNESAAHPEARRRMQEFLANGGQTRDVEIRLGKLVGSLGRTENADVAVGNESRPRVAGRGAN
jgi:enoyl-CoA hydratase/carnithine racemase